MTTELLLSATLGLAFITVGLYFVWRADRERRRQARLQAQYGLYAVRDRIIRMAAAGKLRPDSDLFAGLVDWINIIIGLDDQADFRFHRWMVRIALKEDRARDNAARMVSEAVGPNFHEDEVLKLIAEVGAAVHAVICANSRMFRILAKAGTFDGSQEPEPEPEPENVGSVSLTVNYLPTFTGTFTTARAAH